MASTWKDLPRFGANAMSCTASVTVINVSALAYFLLPILARVKTEQTYVQITADCHYMCTQVSGIAAVKLTVCSHCTHRSGPCRHTSRCCRHCPPQSWGGEHVSWGRGWETQLNKRHAYDEQASRITVVLHPTLKGSTELKGRYSCLLVQ